MLAFYFFYAFVVTTKVLFIYHKLGYEFYVINIVLDVTTIIIHISLVFLEPGYIENDG